MWYGNIVVQQLSTFISGFCLGGGVNTEASNCGAPGLCTSRGHTSIQEHFSFPASLDKLEENFLVITFFHMDI